MQQHGITNNKLYRAVVDVVLTCLNSGDKRESILTPFLSLWRFILRQNIFCTISLRIGAVVIRVETVDQVNGCLLDRGAAALAFALVDRLSDLLDLHPSCRAAKKQPQAQSAIHVFVIDVKKHLFLGKSKPKRAKSNASERVRNHDRFKARHFCKRTCADPLDAKLHCDLR